MHEYGKILVETALERLGVAVSNAGVSTDPNVVARKAAQAGADLIAVSTYNGVALSYLQALRQEMERLGLALPVYVGDKLNQIPDDSASSLPVDVTGDLEALGAIPCPQVEDMLQRLLSMVQERDR